MYDSLNMHSLESSLIDIMRAEQDPMKGDNLRPASSRVQGHWLKTGRYWTFALTKHTVIRGVEGEGKGRGL